MANRAKILLDASNFRPREGQSWRSVRQLLDDCQDGDTKIFFIARHGHSEHNKYQEVFGIDCFNVSHRKKKKKKKKEKNRKKKEKKKVRILFYNPLPVLTHLPMSTGSSRAQPSIPRP